MTASVRPPHLTLINSTDQVVALVPTASISQLAAAVIVAATQWATEANTLASLMGFTPGESNIGQATLRLLDAVHSLEAQAAGIPLGEPS